MATLTRKAITTPPPTIEWNRVGPSPVALVILPCEIGVAIVKRDADGRLYGCREVTLKSHDRGVFAQIVAAWIRDSKSQGLAIEDHAGARAIVREVAAHLVASVAP